MRRALGGRVGHGCSSVRAGRSGPLACAVLGGARLESQFGHGVLRAVVSGGGV